MRVEDVMPIATGHEREEIEAELQVRLPPCALLASSLVAVLLLGTTNPCWISSSGEEEV